MCPWIALTHRGFPYALKYEQLDLPYTVRDSFSAYKKVYKKLGNELARVLYGKGREKQEKILYEEDCSLV